MNLLSLLAIVYSFELGVSNNQISMWESEHPEINIIESNLIDSKLGVKFKFWAFYLGGDVAIPAKINSATSYKPLKSTYCVETGFQINGFEIGYKHYCTHPQNYTWLKNVDNVHYVLEGGSNKFFIKFQHEFRPFKN
jgi:hypothetical protein